MAMRENGISALYSHQVEAWKRASSEQNIVVVTGTASGKTLCYNLPVIDLLLREPNARALYLFPTRALAQDQHAGLASLLGALPSNSSPEISPAVYDGDTPNAARRQIRINSRIVLSNPDMLHTGILPHHTAWSEFFQHLRFVVIDEMHAYRGVFGSHVANVIRRLKRISAHYGAFPTFILTSATIANPSELAGKLVEEPVALLRDDASAHGERHFLIYNPPVVNKELGIRRSALQECVRLAQDLLAYDIQTIIFGRSRRSVELILTYLRQRLMNGPDNLADELISGSDDSDKIRGYRSGYLPNQRRLIEHDLRRGETRIVVATNALELGIDIGRMDASILVGFPGTIASTWQQAGRAGRGEETAISIFIATADPLDQFLAHHPEFLFERPAESGLINPNNLLILLDHLRCAAFELPFREEERFGNVDPALVLEYLEYLRDSGVLHQSENHYFWMSDQYPAQAISLRSASAESIVLQTSSEGEPITVGQVDRASANWMVHPGAVYLHEAESYLVEELDLDRSLAILSRQELDYYTVPRQETSVALIEIYAELPVKGSTKAFGDIRLTTQLTGFKKLRWYTHELLGYGEVSLPPTELLTTGYWFSLDQSLVESIRQQGLWRGDPNVYGALWKKQRDLARTRDGYLCQVCGTPESDRTHDVHHKIPFRAFKDERGNIDIEMANRLENLTTLCPACHQQAEIAVRMRSGLAGLAFALSHIAPLYLMCDSRDLGVNADPLSPLSEGQPAIVLYDRIPAGIGFSQRLFELHDEILERAFELVATCVCDDGCPSCVGPGGEQGTGGKQETVAILKQLVGV